MPPASPDPGDAPDTVAIPRATPPPTQPPPAPHAEHRGGRGELPLADHVRMVNDVDRGERYFEAMHDKIRPGDVVLEVGTGAGLLTCMAVKMGARRVYTVERSPVLCEVAKKVFAANGVADKVTLLHASSAELVASGLIREPIDVFVTETIGTLGLEEGIIPIFEDVKPLLGPKTKIIPEKVKFKQCFVNLSGIRERVEILQPILGIDMSALNAERPSNQFYWFHPIEPWREVSTTAETPSYALLDFSASETEQPMMIVQNNVCDGILTWAEFRLSDDVSIETRHRQAGHSWSNCVHLMNRLAVAYGQPCATHFRVTDDRLSWNTTWHVDALPPAR